MQNKCAKKQILERYKDFDIENNKLIFKPLMLNVIPNNKIDESLSNFYNNFKAKVAGKQNLHKK